MPTYEYRCDECEQRFTRTEKMDTHGKRRPACPKCKSTKVVSVYSPFYAKTAHKA